MIKIGSLEERVPADILVLAPVLFKMTRSIVTLAESKIERLDPDTATEFEKMLEHTLINMLAVKSVPQHRVTGKKTSLAIMEILRTFAKFGEHAIQKHIQRLLCDDAAAVVKQLSDEANSIITDNADAIEKIQGAIGGDFPESFDGEAFHKLMDEHPVVPHLAELMQRARSGLANVNALKTSFEKAAHRFSSIAAVVEAGPAHLESLEAMFNENQYHKLGKHLSDWTAVQASTRELQPGEIRKNLCNKVAKGLAKRALNSMSPRVEAHIKRLAGITVDD